MVTIGEDVKCLYENESIYVPSGARHRLENPGKIDLELIEVQTGSYLGEDDIVRFEDDYNRSKSLRLWRAIQRLGSARWTHTLERRRCCCYCRRRKIIGLCYSCVVGIERHAATQSPFTNTTTTAPGP
jgi:hypothetical protein